MKKIILAQVLTAKGKTEISGLYDRHGNAVPCTKTATGVRLMTTAERNRRWFHENTCV